jgi:hypothetical protein
MQLILFLIGLVLSFQTVFGQEPSELVPKPLFPDDPKGLKLSAAVPRMVDTNGNVVWIDESFTTKQYQKAAFRLVLQEANRVAKELQLPEKLPITETDLVETVVTPFGFNFFHKSVGSVTTKNYCYYVSQGNKFCYLEGTHQTRDCHRFQELYTWPISRMDTNQAYKQAVKYLVAASMDVKAMNRDCQVTVKPDNAYVYSPPGKFVPVYWVSWMRKGFVPNGDVSNVISNDVASVLIFTPSKILLQLRVEDPKYILRKPLLFTNLDSLLPGTAPVIKLPPAQPGPQSTAG